MALELVADGREPKKLPPVLTRYCAEETGDPSYPIWINGDARPTYGCWRWGGYFAIPVSCCRRSPRAARWATIRPVTAGVKDPVR
jgi:hypothetical protein